MNELIEKIGKGFTLLKTDRQRDDLCFVSVEKDQALALVTHCRDFEGFSHFVVLSCVDWIEDGLFQLTYLLNNPTKKYDLGVRTFISRENPEMESAHELWRQIATHQRELKEMYGIDFPGSPRVDEPFLLEGWDDIPPMRRDFDTYKYSEETYFPREGRKTHDPATYMKSKLYPDEEK